MERFEACIKLLGNLEHSCISFFFRVELFSSLPGNVYVGMFFSFSVELTFEQRVKGLMTSSAIAKAAGVGSLTAWAKPNEKPTGLMRKKITCISLKEKIKQRSTGKHM